MAKMYKGSSVWIFLASIFRSNCFFYYSKDVEFLEHDIQSVLHGETLVSCLLLCENTEHCDKIAFKNIENEMFGDCIMLGQANGEDNNSNRLIKQKASLYQKVKLTCEEISCPQNHYCDSHIAVIRNKPCQCVPGFTGNQCKEYTGKGSSEANPHTSCLAIRNEYSRYYLESRYYWVVFQNTSIRMFCDMTTDGGGWTQFANVLTTDIALETDGFMYSSPRDFPVESSENYMLDSSGLKQLKNTINATQLRIYCHKPSVNRTLHIVTTNISNVLEFMAFETDVNPTACGSFTRLSDDTSMLSQTCHQWNYGNFWSHKNKKKGVKTRLYDHVIFYPLTYHVIIVGYKRLCDDNDITSVTGIWRYFIR